MTWVAYHSDLSEVAVFAAAVEPRDAEAPEAVELRARRYAMENHMDVIDLPDGVGLRTAINDPHRHDPPLPRPGESASDIAHRLLGPDIPHKPEPPLLESDLAALVRETLDLQGSVRVWTGDSGMVRIERRTPSFDTESEGRDLSEALTDYRIKEARRVG